MIWPGVSHTTITPYAISTTATQCASPPGEPNTYLLFESQPCLRDMPDLDDYYGNAPELDYGVIERMLAPSPPGKPREGEPVLAEYDEQRLSGYLDSELWEEDGSEGHDRSPSPEESMTPLLQLFALRGEEGELVEDEFVRYCLALLGSAEATNAAKAFVLGMSHDAVCGLAEQVCGGGRGDQTPGDGFMRKISSDPELRAKIQQWGEANFWVWVVAAHAGIAPVTRVAQLPTLNAIVSVADPLIHRGVEWTDTHNREAFITLIVAQLVLEDPRYCTFREDDLQMALQAIAQNVRAPGFSGVDARWMATTGLERAIVRPYFRHQADAEDVLELERRLHPNEEMSQEAGTPEQYAHRLDSDALFGAAVLLAMLIEFERWPVIDQSDDQISLLVLGPLQVLERVFVARSVPDASIGDSLKRSGLKVADAKLMERWAFGGVDFVRNRPAR